MPAPASSKPSSLTLLLDRDGVINENREHYVRSWEDFRFLAGAVDALVTLSQAGYRLVVITNQSMVGRGLVSRAELDAIHARMCQTVERAGGAIADILVCPHAPEDNCLCRKPRPGLILQARERFGLAAGEAYLIGDHEDDIAAAIAGGCRPILVQTGRSTRTDVERQYGRQMAYLPGLPEVAQFLLNGGASTAVAGVPVGPSTSTDK